MNNTYKYEYNEIKDCNLTHIFECGQCFRWNKEESAAEPSTDTETYIGVVGSYACKATFQSTKTTCGGSNFPGSGTLTLEVSGGDEYFWRHYFDLDTDYSEIKDNLKGSPSLQTAINYGYGIRILNQDLFETIISFIVSQNNNIPRIKKCIEALCEHYGESLGVLWGKERFAFPAPEALAKAEPCALADLRLGYRCEYIVQAARRYIADGVPTTYDQVIDYLGVGPKVANCIMLFGLHRVDAFPIDTWVKHIMNDMYGFAESDTRGMAKFAEKNFGKYAGYMQQYLFYYYRDRK